MIDKIDTNQIQELLEKSLARQPNSARTAPNDNETDVSLQVDYASFINKATETPQTDTMAVQRARELLLSGRLETSKNIRAASENIIKFGV